MGIPIVPKSTKILVIGGGPAGAYTASVLAREGFQVTVFEKDHFPRYHVGESMLPSFNAFLEFVGAKEKVKKCGFVMKPGAAIKLNQYKREGYTNFIQFNLENSAWNLLRSEFDDLLLKHAAECGAQVHNGVIIDEIHFSKTDKTRPISASWSSKYGSQTGTISFDWLVDASGRNGIMSTKYLKSRKFNESLRNIATWGYWRGAGVYSPGTDRENAPWFEALTGTVSVGVVVSEKSNRIKKSRIQASSDKDTTVAHYLEQLKLAPGVLRLLGDATFNGLTRSAGDYSYSSKSNHYAGNHYRIAGDAGDLFANVAQRIDPELLTPNAPLMSAKEVDAITGEDEEAKQVLRKHNSNKALSIAFDYQHNFRNEILNGMYVHLEKGELGLRRICD
ncbi:hypothetical protein HHX47_DHR5000557 [Lentinula edodes]|nr:hypothetical protein HHX47_DHR5000557 [Lentinula edodes]